MESKMLEIKAAATAFFALTGTFLGWKGVMLLVWAAAMVLDYISGTMAARKNSEWNSARAREGLFHKGGMILTVLVAMLFDACLALVAINVPGLNMTWPGVIFPVVLAWYILTELGSITENSLKLGAAVPEWLTKGLKISAEAVSKAGNSAADKLGEKDDGHADP